MPTEVESLCCHEFYRAAFLLDELRDELRNELQGNDEEDDATREDEFDEPICVTLHPSFGPHLDEYVLETYFRVPKKNWRRQPLPQGPNGRLALE